MTCINNYYSSKDNFAADREAAEQVIAANPTVLPGVRANRAFRVLADAAETLDFDKPVAVMALMVLQYIPDEDDPWGIVRQLLEAVAPGSYLTVSDTIRDIDTARVTEGAARLNERMPTRLNLRARPEWERFFDNLELVEPGIVPLPEWRGPGSEHPIPCYAGMGRKPALG
jgi:hypothetical protein